MADIRMERMVYAPRDWVVRAWSAPEVLANWFSPDPSVSVMAEVDFSSGGWWRIAMGTDIARGTFIEMNAPSRFAYTWRWENEDDEPESTVTVRLTERSESSTEVLLEHSNIEDSDDASDHERAWTGRLERLDQLARMEFS